MDTAALARWKGIWTTATFHKHLFLFVAPHNMRGEQEAVKISGYMKIVIVMLMLMQFWCSNQRRISDIWRIHWKCRAKQSLYTKMKKGTLAESRAQWQPEWHSFHSILSTLHRIRVFKWAALAEYSFSILRHALLVNPVILYIPVSMHNAHTSVFYVQNN